MPIEYTNLWNIYRNTLPSGSYDMVIVSIAHQNAAMVKWQASNLGRYIKGSFLWIVHYNGEEVINENELPPWAWLVTRYHTDDTWNSDTYACLRKSYEICR